MGHWSAYEQVLVQRGDVTLWRSADATVAWLPKRRVDPLRRATGQDREGVSALRRVVRCCGRSCRRWVSILTPPTTPRSPDAVSLSRLHSRRLPSSGPLHLLVDSTGLSMVGEGAWAAVNHGGRGPRGGKKRPLAVDRAGVIVAHALTADGG